MSFTWDGVSPLGGPHDVIRWDGSNHQAVAQHRGALQEALRPGGRLELTTVRRPRRVAKLLRPYFEGGVPEGDEPFRPVRARGDKVTAFRRGPGIEDLHFEELAPHYDDELPEHVRNHFLQRKVADVVRHGGGRGLEIGCGQGHMAAAVQEATGGRVVAFDRSPRSARTAAGRGLDGVSGDAQHLPFATDSFDFVFAVNMVHHLKRGEQERALAEMARVVRPGGVVIILEINVRNPLFRLYMRHIFPRTRDIDRGDEEFLNPRRFPMPAGASLESVRYSTFLPDFVPRPLFGAAKRVEAFLERTPAAAWGIHMCLTLRADG